MTEQPGGPPVEWVEYTDPLCPWAWGSEPVFRRLRAALPAQVRRRRVFCVLFDEDDDPAPDPAAETAWYAGYVDEVCRHTGAPRAARLSRVAASSWPASLVAKAAELQGAEVAERVLRRLRETVFVLGEPADTPALALSAARGTPGLDLARLSADARSGAVLERVRADRAEARRPVPEARTVPGGTPHPGAARETADGRYRYALPTALLRTPAGHRLVPGWRPYGAYAAAVRELCPRMRWEPEPDPAAPDEALRRHGSLTVPEARLLTDGPWPPPGAVRVETGNGPLWLHPDEAATHPATRPDAPPVP
ncbi:DsbA family oxidoreductase [Streptomyces griseoflavus]|uniref:DsbA family oxidoreductase n=1 Tax=Streptomyces griseoflavus TaxID=35619 RepID=UPI0001B4EACD|nr:DsbA family protein [Streptomyces griseoflavus]